MGDNMTPTALLRQAHEAGLTVFVRGDQLVVRGQPEQEPLARALLARKADLYPIVKATMAFVPPATDTTGTTDANRPAPPSEAVLALDLPDASTWCRKAAALISTIGDRNARLAMRELFEERAAVCEFCGNMTRDEAERKAYHLLEQAMQRGGLA